MRSETDERLGGLLQAAAAFILTYLGPFRATSGECSHRFLSSRATQWEAKELRVEALIRGTFVRCSLAVSADVQHQAPTRLVVRARACLFHASRETWGASLTRQNMVRISPSNKLNEIFIALFLSILVSLLSLPSE